MLTYASFGTMNALMNTWGTGGGGRAVAQTIFKSNEILKAWFLKASLEFCTRLQWSGSVTKTVDCELIASVSSQQ